MAESRIVLVTGATGKQGGAVIKHLRKAKKFTIRALTRDCKSRGAQMLKAQGINLVEASLEDPVALDLALAGVESVFSVQNYWQIGVGYEGEIRQGKNLADAAKKNGVLHFVHSTMASPAVLPPENLKHFKSKFLVEKYIDELQIPRTFLGTVTYMDNFIDPKFGGKWTFPFISKIIFDTTPYYMLSLDDLGGIAAAVLAEPTKYIGRKLNLVSDCPTILEMRRIYQEVAGKKSSSIKLPVWLCKLLNHEFVEQLQWQSQGGWNFSKQESSLIYPNLTSFRDFILMHQLTNL